MTQAAAAAAAATMATGDPAQASEAPWQTMSIARLIPRFAKPQLLTTNIPTYRQSFSLPIQDKPHVPNDPSAQTPSVSKQQPQDEPSTASYLEWSKLLPAPSNLVGSFHHLFEFQAGHRTLQEQDVSTAATQNGHAPRSSSAPPPPPPRPPPRLVFFGEQHHQPEVLRAQLQALQALEQQCQLASTPRSAQSDAPPIYRLHLILEHFSILDQHMLHSFSHGQIDPDQLAQAYREQSHEAFHIGHYMPLLMLANELNVPIWAGFPPRSWATQVFRHGVESVKPDQYKRANPSQLHASPFLHPTAQQAHPSTPKRQTRLALPQPPLFTSWNAVTKIGAAHRSYLSALMRPDLPPRFPQLPPTVSPDDPHHSTDEASKHRQPVYPTWLLKPHNIETKGFGPAQALKDSYLAHVTAWILRGQDEAAISGSNQQAAETTKSSVTHPDDLLASQHAQSCTKAEQSASGRRVVNIALVVCGLGHCEYGFGAPERVVQLLSEQSSSPSADDTATLLPYIIASKPLDSGIWLGYEHPSQPSALHDHHTQNDVPAILSEPVEPRDESADAVERWLNDPWGRKVADAVLLYDWIDQEPTQEVDANADGHQAATS